MIPLENRSTAMFIIKQAQSLLRDVTRDNIIECDILKVVEARDKLNRALKLLGLHNQVPLVGHVWIGETRPSPEALVEVMKAEQALK